MPRPTSGRLSRRAGGARNVVPPTARRSACLPSCWPTCLQRCFRAARCICNGFFCMRSSYATMYTAAEAVRQRRSASSSCCTGVELMMKLRRQWTVGSRRIARNLLQARQEYSGSRLARAALARESPNLHRHSVPFANLGAAPTRNNNGASGSLRGALRSPSGRRTGETQAADAGAQRAAHRHNVRHPPAAAED